MTGQIAMDWVGCSSGAVTERANSSTSASTVPSIAHRRSDFIAFIRSNAWHEIPSHECDRQSPFALHDLYQLPSAFGVNLCGVLGVQPERLDRCRNSRRQTLGSANEVAAAWSDD
jgi:hypothetical protein